MLPALILRSITSAIVLFAASYCYANPVTNPVANPVVYTQLTSLKNQPALGPINLASLEIVSGIENIGNAPTSIKVEQGGYYFVIAAGQAGAIRDNPAGGNQHVDIWFIKNGASIPNSTSRITVSPDVTGTVITQNIIFLSENDTLSVGFTATDPSYGLVGTLAKDKEPAVTSLTLTAYKI
jgi:hypothetical protein